MTTLTESKPSACLGWHTGTGALCGHFYRGRLAAPGLRPVEHAYQRPFPGLTWLDPDCQLRHAGNHAWAVHLGSCAEVPSRKNLALGNHPACGPVGFIHPLRTLFHGSDRNTPERSDPSRDDSRPGGRVCIPFDAGHDVCSFTGNSGPIRFGDSLTIGRSSWGSSKPWPSWSSRSYPSRS